MKEVKGSKPKAVVFDIDGTIIDSMEVFYQDLREICQRVGLSQVSKEKVLEIMRRGVSPQDFLIPIDFPDRGNVINQCQAIDKEIWAEIYRREVKLFPGCAEVMRRIKGAGIKIGVVSSGWEGEGENTGTAYLSRSMSSNYSRL